MVCLYKLEKITRKYEINSFYLENFICYFLHFIVCLSYLILLWEKTNWCWCYILLQMTIVAASAGSILRIMYVCIQKQSRNSLKWNWRWADGIRLPRFFIHLLLKRICGTFSPVFLESNPRSVATTPPPKKYCCCWKVKCFLPRFRRPSYTYYFCLSATTTFSIPNGSHR